MAKMIDNIRSSSTFLLGTANFANLLFTSILIFSAYPIPLISDKPKTYGSKCVSSIPRTQKTGFNEQFDHLQ